MRRLPPYLVRGRDILIADDTAGWEKFRVDELAVLKKMLQEKPMGHVFACGGGIVETSEARQLLNDYRRSGGLVLLVERDIEEVMAYLQLDKSRPAYMDDMKGVWLRRKEWYKQCSNYQHYSQKAPSDALTKASKDLERLIGVITGQRLPLDKILAKEHSFFVSLTIPDVATALGSLQEVVVGSDAVELRVDLLNDPLKPDAPPSVDFVANQLALLRGSCDVPVIYTIRTVGQGGKILSRAFLQSVPSRKYRVLLKFPSFWTTVWRGLTFT